MGQTAYIVKIHQFVNVLDRLKQALEPGQLLIIGTACE